MYTDNQFGNGYKPTKYVDMDQISGDEETELSHTARGYINLPNGRRPGNIFDDSIADSNNYVEST